MKLLKYIFLFSFIFHIAAYSYFVYDIEKKVRLKKNDKQFIRYYLDCGKQSGFLKYGMNFSIFRKGERGVFDNIARVETESIGNSFCRTKLIKLSTSLESRNLELPVIVKGDMAFPSVTIFSNTIFNSINSSTLTSSGKTVIKNRIIPFLNNEYFKNMRIYSYLDRHKDSYREIDLAKNQANAIKKYLKTKYGVPQDFIEIIPMGNTQNMYLSKFKNKNARQEIVFIPYETNEEMTGNILDRDGDGIPDVVDKCPDQPETFNGFEDEDGCPDSWKLKKGDRIILDNVYFKTGSPELTVYSFPVLKNFKKIFDENPGIKMLIEGHTDSTGTKEYNLKLSDARANSVKKYLINTLGVGTDQLQSKGFGEERPIADNGFASGRARNRRVEMKVLSNGGEDESDFEEDEDGEVDSYNEDLFKSETIIKEEEILKEPQIIAPPKEIEFPGKKQIEKNSELNDKITPINETNQEENYQPPEKKDDNKIIEEKTIKIENPKSEEIENSSKKEILIEEKKEINTDFNKTVENGQNATTSPLEKTNKHPKKEISIEEKKEIDTDLNKTVENGQNATTPSLEKTNKHPKKEILIEEKKEIDTDLNKTVENGQNATTPSLEKTNKHPKKEILIKEKKEINADFNKTVENGQNTTTPSEELDNSPKGGVIENIVPEASVPAPNNKKNTILNEEDANPQNAPDSSLTQQEKKAKKEAEIKKQKKEEEELDMEIFGD